MRNHKPVGRRKFLKSTAFAIGAGQFWQAGMGALPDHSQPEVHTRQGRHTLYLDGEWEIDGETSLIHPASRGRGRLTGARAEVFREARKPSVFLQRVVRKAKLFLSHFGTPGRALTFSANSES